MSNAGYTFREAAISAKHKEIANKVADLLVDSGLNTCDKIINYQAAKHKYGHIVSDRGVEIQLAKAKEDSTYQFATGGNFLIDSFTTKLVSLIQENYGQDLFKPTALDMIFPDNTGYDSQTILVDVWAAPGGSTPAYSYGSAVQKTTRVGNRGYAYEGAPYRSFIGFDENDITFLRALGNPEFGARGIMQRVTMAVLQAKTLNFNAKQLIKATVFANQISITPQLNGLTTVVNYQIPAYNIVSSITNPGTGPTNQWAQYNTTTNAIVFNAAANPIADLQYLLNIYSPWLTRVGQLSKCKMIMSRVTNTIFTRHPSVLALFNTNLAYPRSQFSTYGNYTFDNIMKSLLPGFDGEIIIDDGAYLFANSDTIWTPDGFSADPLGQGYFLPPGQILFAVDPSDSPLGDFVYTPAIQNGGAQGATPGEWIITQDLTSPLIPNGVLQPSVQVSFGFAGGLRVLHPESTFIGNFIVTTS